MAENTNLVYVGERVLIGHPPASNAHLIDYAYAAELLVGKDLPRIFVASQQEIVVTGAGVQNSSYLASVAQLNQVLIGAEYFRFAVVNLQEAVVVGAPPPIPHIATIARVAEVVVGKIPNSPGLAQVESVVVGSYPADALVSLYQYGAQVQEALKKVPPMVPVASYFSPTSVREEAQQALTAHPAPLPISQVSSRWSVQRVLSKRTTPAPSTLFSKDQARGLYQLTTRHVVLPSLNSASYFGKVQAHTEVMQVVKRVAVTTPTNTWSQIATRSMAHLVLKSLSIAYTPKGFVAVASYPQLALCEATDMSGVFGSKLQLIATAHKVLVDSFDSLPAPVSMTGPVLTREAVQLAMQKEPRPLPISQVSAVWGTQLALSHADATAYPPLGNAPSVTTAEVVSEVLPVLSKADPLTAPQDFYSSVEVARQYQQVARYAPMALPHSPSSLLSLAQSTLTREQVPAPFGSVQAKQASLGWLMAHPMTPPYQMYDPAKSAYLVQLARKSIQSSKAGFVAPGDMTDVLQRIDALRVAVALVASFPDPMIPVSLGQVSSTLEVLAVAATYPDPLLPVSIEQVSDVVEAIAISSPYPDASEGVLYQVEELQVVTLMAGDYPDKDDPQTDYLTDALIEVVATTGTYIDKDEPQSTVTASSVSEVIAQGAAYPDKDSPQSTVSADAVAVVTSQSAAYEDKDTPHSLVASDYVGADVAVSAVYVDKDLPQSNGQTAGLAETIATRASYPPALAGYSTVQSDNVWLVMAQQAQYGPVDQFKRHQSVITVTYS